MPWRESEAELARARAEQPALVESPLGRLVGVFTVAPAMELAVMDRASADHKDWRHMLKALGKAENWRALTHPKRWRYMAAVAGRVARRGVGMKGDDLPVSAGFLEDFGALTRS